MIDAITQKPLRVLAYDPERPYLVVPMSQLDRVQELLDGHEVRYSLDEYAISLDGKPETVAIRLGLGGDALRVQSILDASASAPESRNGAGG